MLNRIKLPLFFILFVFFITEFTFAQTEILRVEPPNWWLGMKNPELQLLVYGKDIATYRVEIDRPDVKLLRVTPGKSSNYLFVDIELSQLKTPGNINLRFYSKGKKPIDYAYAIKKREPGAERRKGFDSSDVIYLITPDRFANGDPSNDRVMGLKEQVVNRKDDYARHGGDIRGIINHLDYIEKMGFTAVWPSPLLINDMAKESYHGYAITDFYKVDPRFGSLEDYIELSEKARERGLKLIMDQVVNHCGVSHWWINDLPFDDWLNYQKEFENGNIITTNHRHSLNQDPYAAKTDKKRFTQGWFVPTMPDLNQKNPFLATYLIQNSIWWVETLGLGGIRQDTYPYPDKEFMAKWAGALMYEYPDFNIVGEEWSYNPLIVGYWQESAKNKDEYRSHLGSVMDFPIQKAIIDGINEEESWGGGLIKLYEGLANDFSYAKPEKILAFLDNHDKSRVFTEFKKDPVKTQMALAYLLSIPRIVQVYYGTEILMHDTAKPGDHGLIRSDFPGGWAGDPVNVFSGKGLTPQQKQMQHFIKTLLNYRKHSKAIHKGKTLHYIPENGMYLLSRSYGDETFVLILNKNEKPVSLDLNQFNELGLQAKKMKNLITGEMLIWNGKINLKTKGAVLLTTKL